MRKFVLLFVAVAGLAVFTACGNEGTQEATQETTTDSTEVVETPAETPATDSTEVAVDSTENK